MPSGVACRLIGSVRSSSRLRHGAGLSYIIPVCARGNSGLQGLLRPLWEYLALSDAPRTADVIFVFGSADRAVPARAAALYAAGYAPRILVSGSFGRLTRGRFDRPEAHVFRDLLVADGVPPAAVVTEPAATNTLENVRLGMAALAAHGHRPRSALLVAKGFAMRRCVATFAGQFPAVRVRACPPLQPLPTAIDRSLPAFAARLVAELDRLQRYAAQGDIRAQPIPPAVTAAGRRVAAELDRARSGGRPAAG